MKHILSSNYFKLFSFSFLITCIAYGFALINFSLSIDSEQVIYEDIFLPLGRWGANLIRYHIFGDIIPHFTLLVSLFFLSLTAVELSRLLGFKGIMGYFFCGLFLTFPQMAYQLIFTLQADAITIGFLSSVLAMRFFIKSLDHFFSLKFAGYFTLSALLFMFSIAVYQALAFIPVLIYLIIFFKNTYTENYNFKTEFKKGLIFIGLTIASVVLYFISTKIFCPKSSSGFFSAYTQDNPGNIFTDFFDRWKILLKGNAYYGNKTFIIATVLLAVIMIRIFFQEKKKLLIRFITLLSIMIVPFIISLFITNGIHPPRLYVASGIAFAFIIIYFITTVKFQKVFLALASLVIVANIYYITKLFLSHYRLYNNDIKVARNIDSSIRTKYPDFDPANDYVYFFGSLPYSEGNEHRLPNAEIFGGSFFIWDNGSNDRIINFMKFSDVAHYRIIDNKETYLKIKDSINPMPTWPKDGYIKRLDNVIVVKLGVTKGANLWVE
ncbi:hypothetical protein E0W68_06935 [Flavobacterium salilacus subsp. salilacus]|uniref:glucosyltransferase domain-containing protein n=1 Tax=Flavobacterium TaxID=237 RepID=UPI0010753BD1|nr:MULTISPECIES: glucosyltransferase domain-containing protein [Flavobacterium]KAF2518986.1 hypothetical protein E0W68_06935 [Flavobacterium salilacus subsp. salilacus]MBE1614851.1 glucosyltransferase domain-containing protein [Flavobacterium sp. SaA2.13]